MYCYSYIRTKQCDTKRLHCILHRKAKKCVKNIGRSHSKTPKQSILALHYFIFINRCSPLHPRRSAVCSCEQHPQTAFLLLESADGLYGAQPLAARRKPLNHELYHLAPLQLIQQGQQLGRQRRHFLSLQQQPACAPLHLSSLREALVCTIL